MKGGEVIVLSRDARGSSGVGMEDLSIDPLQWFYTSLDHRDLAVEGVADIGAGLGASPLVKVGNGVVVGVGDIVLGPVVLENATRVILVVITFQGIFYLHYLCK